MAKDKEGSDSYMSNYSDEFSAGRGVRFCDNAVNGKSVPR